MKTLWILVLPAILFFMNACNSNKTKISQKATSQLDSLYRVQDYFKLRAELETHKADLDEKTALYFDALQNYVFNKQEASNKAVNALLAKYKAELSDTALSLIYRAKRMNHVNLYEYKQAAEAGAVLLSNFKSVLDSADYAEFENEQKIWTALADAPKQEIIRNQDSKIDLPRDKVGLMNIETVFGSDTVNFLFDTGANFSVMTKSLADSLGLAVIDADFYVTAATGAKVKSKVALADFSIRNITCKNVVFLVFNDEDLSFPQIDYYPNGAIGFPVIKAFEEVRFDKDDNIFVPEIPAEYHYNNLALDGLMPVIAALYQTDTLRFHFDTGASATSLYSAFYEKYKTEIEQKYTKTTFKSGSAGGHVEFSGFVIPEFELSVADSDATLDSVRLHIKNIGGAENNFHGNFGQDYIRQFNEMIISFKYSSLIFK